MLVFDLVSGTLLVCFKSIGTLEGAFHSPRKVDVLNDALVVVDQCNHRVHVFDHEGQHPFTFAASPLDFPSVLAIAATLPAHPLDESYGGPPTSRDAKMPKCQNGRGGSDAGVGVLPVGHALLCD